MLTAVRRLSVFPLFLTAAVGVAACGSSKSSSSTTTASTAATTTSASASVPVVGKSTSVILNPKTAELLAKNGIAVSAVAPATAKTALVFPTTSGHIAVATLTGTVEDSGGLTLTHAGKSVQLTGFVIDTSSKQVTAQVAGQRLPVLEPNLSSLLRKTGPNATIVASNIALTLTSQAASSLNSGLGVSAFKAGQLFGVATLTLATKA